MTLVQDTKERSYVAPTLCNLKYNVPILKPLTEEMARAGRISKPIHLIKTALHKFYDMQSEEMQETPETMQMKLRRERNISKTAKSIVAMLTVIKRKWTKWEMPRECGPASSVATGDTAESDMDDDSLRADLHALSRGSTLPESCLIAPPQKALEKFLGISLDPEFYRNLTGKVDSLQGSAGELPAPPSEVRAPPSEVRAPPSEVRAPPSEVPAPPSEVRAPQDDLGATLVVADPLEPPAEESLHEGTVIPDTPQKASTPLSPGESPGVEILSVKPAEEPSDLGAVKATGLAGQLAAMDPRKLKELLAVVNSKLRMVPKGISNFSPAPLHDDVRKKLNFEGSSDGEGSTSAGSSSADQLETQLWEPTPEDSVNAWMHQHRSEDAARVEAAQAREKALVEAREEQNRADELKQRMQRREQLNISLRTSELEEAVGKPATKLELVCNTFVVVTRSSQLALTARKKDKTGPAEDVPVKEAAEPEDAPDDDNHGEDMAAEAVGSRGKPKAKVFKKPAAKVKAKAAPKTKAKAKAKAESKPKGADDDKDEPEEDAVPTETRGVAKVGRFVRKSSKRRLICKGTKLNKKKKKIAAESAPTEYYDENEWPEEEWSKEEWDKWEQEAEVEEAEDAGDEDEEKIPTFARRYCAQRPFFKAKFLGIRDAFNAGIRPFLVSPGKHEDPFWRFVAKATKEKPVQDADDWLGAFILALLCLLFNERFRSIEEYLFVEHYAGSKQMTGVIESMYGGTAALDIAYHRAMNILTPTGFATET
ncbi:unnamed protein product [Symbiodinium necroappetens]|uniref:Uncharacterized protein n=1 Tax=Symbiodinium necroappetens TaxID=1628268 RepID=A0A812JYH0_9DINO|nr:unnamed protein product [Symbiodinium necroappetens]